MNLELRLSVEDSPNSAGVAIDAIRCCKLALLNKISGPLLPVCAYLMKHPPQQMPDTQARELLDEFISRTTNKKIGIRAAIANHNNFKIVAMRRRAAAFG